MSVNKRFFKTVAAAILLFFCININAQVLQEITVRDGDTLWGIANYYLKDPQRWPEIIKYNKLPSSDPSVVLPGMKLRVPILLIKEQLRAAHLIYILNEVKFRRKAQPDWQKALTDMELYNEDGLRTFSESRARVKFFSGETLYLDENSLAILKPEEKQEEIDLMSGGVRASRTKVLARNTIINPKIEPNGPAPDFRAKVKEDKTTLVEVYEGRVDVTAEGKTVTVTKGFGTEVKFMQPPSLPKTLPPMPDIIPGKPELSADTNPNMKVQAVSKNLELTMKLPEPVYSGSRDSSQPQEQKTQFLSQTVAKYHLQISSSPGFENPVINETNPFKEKVSVDFKKIGLPDGFYFYRLAYVDQLGFESKFSSPAQFLIDSTPPKLDITTPQDQEQFDTEFVHIEGKTDPGTDLKVNEAQADVDTEGNFITALIPEQGKNTIKFTASDRSGNITVRELVIYKVKVVVKDKNTAARKVVPEKGKGFISVALGSLTIFVILGVAFLIVK
jgi:hypothetical protein